MALDAALSAPHTLSGNAPEEPLTLVAVSGRRGRPKDKVVRSRARNRVDQGLKSLLIDVKFLNKRISL